MSESMTARTLVAGNWEIDPVHSEVSFSVRHMMVSKVRGRFGRFAGTIVTGADSLDSEATARIELDSIDTGNQQRDDHVRSADFFDVKRYPEMTYRSISVRRDGDGYLAEGELTIRGVTKPVELRVELNGVGPDAYGGTRIGLSAAGEINRTDFGVSYNGPIPGGGSILGDRVQIAIEVEAVLQA